MLLDILGIITAFIAVVLIFSIIVTAIVEAVQHALQIRNANLCVGFAILRSELKLSDEAWNDFKKAFLDDRMPEQRLSYARPVLVEPNEVVDFMEANDLYNEAHIVEFERLFPRIEAAMRQRYKSIMSIFTMLASLFVVIAFQLNCFNILGTIPSYYSLISAEKRIITAEQKNTHSVIHHDAIARQVIESFLVKHPQIQMTLPGNSAESARLLLYKKIDALENQPKLQAQLISHYDEFLLSATSSADNNELGELQKTDKYLLSNKNSILSHWVGMLFTAFLLSLGAPFWFEVLHKLLIIRKKF